MTRGNWTNVGPVVLPSDTPTPGSIARGLQLCTRNEEVLPVTCAVCNRVGHDNPACELLPTAYRKVGIEIEGWWLDLATWRTRSHGILMDRGNPDGIQHEFRTTAANPTGCLEQLYDFYPDGTHQACGMHVHVSFDSAADVSLLANDDFLHLWEQSWTEWGTGRGLPSTHEFWTRLHDRNSFCRALKKMPASIPTHTRYYQLNWTAWEKGYKTLECRMLPMFDNRSDAISAVVHLVGLYDMYLSNVSWEVTDTAQVPAQAPVAEVVTYQYEARLPGGPDVHAYESTAVRLPDPAPGNKYVSGFTLRSTLNSNMSHYGRPVR